MPCNAFSLPSLLSLPPLGTLSRTNPRFFAGSDPAACRRARRWRCYKAIWPRRGRRSA